MTDKLKPCPFCGGTAEIVETSVAWVRCLKCDSETQASDSGTVVGAIAIWNTRYITEGYAIVPVTPTKDMLEAAGEYIDFSKRLNDQIRDYYKAMLKAAKEQA